MREAGKIGMILLLILSGCSVSRIGRFEGSLAGRGRSVSHGILTSNNLTNGSFHIQKAEVAIRSEDISQKFLANIRYADGEYLVSLRSRAGLEVARIFISRDTVLANDRINRVLYFGEPDILAAKYGIPYDILPLILGDFLTENFSGEETEKCLDGKLEMPEFIRGIKLNYLVDCRKGKIISAEREGSLGEVISRTEYSEFGVTGGIEVPSQIKMQDFRSETTIEIKLGKIEKPWNESLEFIPGRRYDLIELR